MVTERVLSALPKLKIISKYGNGSESFDFQAMQPHGVRFGCTRGGIQIAKWGHRTPASSFWFSIELRPHAANGSFLRKRRLERLPDERIFFVIWNGAATFL